MKTINIAIDGPAGAGKSSISKIIAKELGFLYIDTGAMYRSVALFAIENGIEKKQDSDKLIALLSTITVNLKHENNAQHIFLNGRDVTELIRTQEVSISASDVAVIPEVRLFLVEMQRKIARENNVIMDGRDIGTYVLPNAQVKIFLTASLQDRAIRRYNEFIEKGQTVDFEEVKKDMQYRDENDSTRAFAPLKMAEDSILADTSGKSLEESVEMVTLMINERLSIEKN